MDSDLNQCWNCRQAGRFHCQKCQFAFYCSEKCQQTDLLRHEVECERVIQMRTCSGCGQSPDLLLRCCSCFLAYYCNKACQSRHWPRHKKPCKKFQHIVLDAATKHNALIALANKALNLPWYIGRYMAEDYLRLHQNEGSSTERELRLLFVGLGDIKDVVRTITDLPPEFKGNLHFVLNDNDPHMSARNLLLIYCALTNPTAEFFVQIWYSIWLTPKVLKFLVARLKELTTMTRQEVLSKLKNYIRISTDYWPHCVQIWKGWYGLILDTDAADKMFQIRRETFSNIYYDQPYLNTIPQENYHSVMDFIDKGLLLPLDSPERRDAVFPNCTLACYNSCNPKFQGKFVDISQINYYEKWAEICNSADEMVLGMTGTACVLNSWDYLVVKETVGKKDDVLDMYLSYLTGLLQTFSDQIGSGRVTFHFIVDDFQRLERHFATNETFDRISVSNLSDYYGYPLLLKQFGSRLNKYNECSVLISHHESWPFLTEGHNWDTLILKTAGCSDEFNNAPRFLSSLACEAAVYLAKQENSLVTKQFIKHPAQVAQNFGLHLRDYCCELNQWFLSNEKINFDAFAQSSSKRGIWNGH